MDYFYRKVWAPNGQMFEVTHEKAAQLVLNKGWSNNPPTEAKKSKTKKASKKTVDAVEEEFRSDAMVASDVLDGG